MVKVTDSQGTPEMIAEYAYDARNFRVVRKLYASGTLDKTLDDYFTADWQCVEERVDASGTQTLSVQYVWGLRYVDDLVQRQRDTTGNATLDETLYALTDTRFNVVALSDGSGNIVQRMSYTPYGKVTFLTSSYGPNTNTKAWEHLFQGLRLDPTGFYDNRRRPLDPLTGRFLIRDPEEYVDGMNLYAYTVNNPQTLIDPLGTASDVRCGFNARDPGRDRKSSRWPSTTAQRRSARPLPV